MIYVNWFRCYRNDSL